ncbi:hydrogenase nickel incorporation protein HypA/HybF [Flavobacterium sp. 90]|uniref:hydrogenase maturation nickel metallochaperone HypA/HybF n=1 Tax=unclassified Flavobacterium TaxID=196869 RepID=UPI000EB4F028|nr:MULTISPECIES: hydrogenase maturation nickel metallochaperone HypA [unclassified Flavobacterium]RKR11715.1 hydrogenase nickel incorporation protein HypA/HybF [Flavobacterium sp. 81]TCK55491.1 hydrogenase nickel incorporation protein HypA/HybF [Flavobacterium sp. 90]
MHELSVVTSIVKIVQQEVDKIKGKKALELYLEIGKLSGVEITSFHFIWPQCIYGSVLSDVKLFIDEPVGKARCAECETEFHINKSFDSCPNCDSPFKEIIAGKELKIKKIIIK